MTVKVVFLPEYRRACLFARNLVSLRESLDLPFPLFDGKLDGDECRIMVVREGSDAAYAAARIAIRRGARMLVPISDGIAVSEAGIQPGTITPVGTIWNLDSLSPLIQVLPESAAEVTYWEDDLLPSAPVLTNSDRPVAAGTLAHPTTNRALLRKTHEALGVSVFERQLGGYAQAAAEFEVPLVAGCFIQKVIRDSLPHLSLGELSAGKSFDRELPVFIREMAMLPSIDP